MAEEVVDMGEAVDTTVGAEEVSMLPEEEAVEILLHSVEVDPTPIPRRLFASVTENQSCKFLNHETGLENNFQKFLFLLPQV